MATPYIPAFTQDNLTALEQSIADGALSVEFADKKTTYQTTSEMLKLREMIKGALGMNQGRSLRVYNEHCKGL